MRSHCFIHHVPFHMMGCIESTVTISFQNILKRIWSQSEGFCRWYFHSPWCYSPFLHRKGQDYPLLQDTLWSSTGSGGINKICFFRDYITNLFVQPSFYGCNRLRIGQGMYKRRKALLNKELQEHLFLDSAPILCNYQPYLESFRSPSPSIHTQKNLVESIPPPPSVELHFRARQE